jgi:predicted acyltransferase
MMSAAAVAGDRLISLDQFRGYSVAAMFVVNFLGHQAITHHLLKHNNTHFSYADSIMPSFILACGFSYRMTFRKNQHKDPDARTWAVHRKFAVRGLQLMLLSLMLYGFNSQLGNWSDLTLAKVNRFLAELWKANLWEVLAIIGACQVLLVPCIGFGPGARWLLFLVLGALNVVLAWSFQYDFVYGQPNWMDSVFGSTGKRAWDGGFFGLLAWSQIMLAGTLAYDLTHGSKPAAGLIKILSCGTLLMLAGYGLSCLSTLYNTAGRSVEEIEQMRTSPVLPNLDRARSRSWNSLCIEPPLVPPPPPQERIPNYWAMDKRVVTESFVFFSAGCAMTLYGLFILACDAGGLGLGVFRTFGQNPLAAYIVHFLVVHSWMAVVPKDAPLSWTLSGLVCSFGITYAFVRFLENRGLFLRL